MNRVYFTSAPTKTRVVLFASKINTFTRQRVIKKGKTSDYYLSFRVRMEALLFVYKLELLRVQVNTFVFLVVVSSSTS